VVSVVGALCACDLSCIIAYPFGATEFLPYGFFWPTCCFQLSLNHISQPAVPSAFVIFLTGGIFCKLFECFEGLVALTCLGFLVCGWCRFFWQGMTNK